MTYHEKISAVTKTTPRSNPNEQIQFLDGLRGLAAFYIMVFHARWLLWEGYLTGYVTHPEQYSVAAKVVIHLILLFSFGHQMVLLFFVLSGFVIHLRYARQIKEQQGVAQFDWRRYVYRRAKRLYPPLIFTMILTFGLDQLGKTLGFPVYFVPTVLNLDFKPNHEIITGIGNLVFVMSVYVAPWGMNGALWSLTFEWWFYMIYPFFWWLTKRSITVATGIMVGLYILSFFGSLWPIQLLQVVFSGMLCWWFGALLAEIYVGRLRISFWKIAPLSLLILVLAPITFLLPKLLPVVIQDTLWAMAFAGLLAICFAWQRQGRSLHLLECLKPLGDISYTDISYTLYVTHFPILIFISGWLMARSPDQTLPQNISWIFVGISVCLGVAYGAHFITEKPFITVKSVVS
jgi:peptidoglycan/LPS O-acetylase OafA/YrhL